MELEDYKESKLIKGLIKVGIVFFVLLFILQIYALINNNSMMHDNTMVEPLKKYYEFSPSSRISVEAGSRYEVYTLDEIQRYDAMVYTEYLTEWAQIRDVDLLRLELCTYYRQQGIHVLTYINPLSYEIKWSDFVLPLSEGRWFEGDNNEVICVNSSYKIGDVISIKNSDGVVFQATVVGRTDYSALIDNISMSGNLAISIHRYSGMDEVFLLNPQCKFNEKTDFINYGTTLIKTNNDTVISKINEYGTCTPISQILSNNEPDYVTPLIILIISLIAIGLLMAGEFILHCQKGTVGYIVLGGVLANIYGIVMYVNIEYKRIIAVLICVIIALVYIIVNKINEQKNACS